MPVSWPGERSEAFSDTIAAGSIASTAPAAGAEVAPGSSVSYVVSQGVEPVAVPDLVDQPEDEALAALDAAGLVAGERSEAFSDTIAAGSIASTAPAAGAEVAPGSSVSYVVSIGTAPSVVIPKVRNMSEDDAVAAIASAGLTVGDTIQQPHGDVAAGDAIKTDPAAAEEIHLDQR